jgi:uncharacterized cupredoxin-like copper-binding protein
VTKLLGTVVLAAALSWHPTPARLGVSTQEFHLVLSRPSVKTGHVEIELQNDGEDVHDLRLRRVGGTRTYVVPNTKPGRRRTIEVALLPGRYRLWCSVANHRALGMQAVLRVRH